MTGSSWFTSPDSRMRQRNGYTLGGMQRLVLPRHWQAISEWQDVNRSQRRNTHGAGDWRSLWRDRVTRNRARNRCWLAAANTVVQSVRPWRFNDGDCARSFGSANTGRQLGALPVGDSSGRITRSNPLTLQFASSRSTPVDKTLPPTTLRTSRNNGLAR